MGIGSPGHIRGVFTDHSTLGQSQSGAVTLYRLSRVEAFRLHSMRCRRRSPAARSQRLVVPLPATSHITECF